MRAFLARLRRTARLPPVPFAAVEELLLRYFARAMERYSSILEFSFSVHGHEASPYRFSCSFPAFGEGRTRSAIRSCRALVVPFGAGAQRIADRILDHAQPELVQQILFGIDATRESSRLKIYFQFPEGRAWEKAGLAARLLPGPARHGLADAPDRLHLLCIDFDRAGIIGYKLYFLHARVPLLKLRRAFPRAALLEHLAARRRIEVLDDVLLISRFGPRGEADGPPIAEVDVGLRANGLGWPDVAGYYARRTIARPFRSFGRTVLVDHRWAATWLLVPVSGAAKLNVYYTLLDPPRRKERSRR